MKPKLISHITCPHCGLGRDERMPVDACQWYYQCNRLRETVTTEIG